MFHRLLLSHPVLIGFSFAAAWLLCQTPFIKQAEWATLDWRSELRTYYQPPPDPRIAIVLFDDLSERTVLGAWPIDRKWHAEFMTLLANVPPAVLCWDIIFEGEGKSKEGDKDMGDVAKALQKEIGTRVISAACTSIDQTPTLKGKAGPTVPITKIRGDIALVPGADFASIPFPYLRAETKYGFADFPPNTDGIRREIPVVVRVGNQLFPGLALQTLLSYYKVSTSAVTVHLGHFVRFETKDRVFSIPIDESGQCWVNYRYDRNPQFDRKRVDYDIPSYSYAYTLLQLNERFNEKKPKAPIPPLKDKIVFVGQVVEGKADAGPTPLSSMSPLTLLQANFCNNVLREDYVRRLPDWALWCSLAVLTWCTFSLMAGKRAWWLAVASVVGITAFAQLACFVWIRWSFWLPFIGPTFGFSGASFLIVIKRLMSEQRAKERVKGMFSSYLSPVLLSKILKSADNLTIRSERRPVTILFTDLRDFTAWSEKVSEDELISQLNEYLAAMVGCIHAEGGTLHKFIGDAVMAAWGDLSTRGTEEDAASACRAALAMLARLDELNKQWAAAGRHTLRMGVGINHGVVLVGNIGSPSRMEFTVIGDPVNLASRLESLNKQMHSEILAGESVHALVGTRFNFTPRGAVPVKGKAEPVPIFELQSGAPK